MELKSNNEQGVNYIITLYLLEAFAIKIYLKFKKQHYCKCLHENFKINSYHS